jgi:hypothetical protein
LAILETLASNEAISGLFDGLLAKLSKTLKTLLSPSRFLLSSFSVFGSTIPLSTSGASTGLLIMAALATAGATTAVLATAALA